MFVSSISGCDMISSIKEHLTKGTKQASASVPKSTAVKQQPKAATQPTQKLAKQTAKPQVKPSVANAQTKSMAKPMAKNYLAKVGSWTITMEEFNDRLDALKEVVPDFDATNADAKKLILEELVRQRLIVADAENSGIANDKDIVAAVEEFRSTLLVREVARKLTENIKVTDEEAKAFYEERKDEIIEPTEYRVREIVLKDQIKANEILVEILKGSDFAELAKLNSESKTASKGGDLGYISQEPFAEMAPQILALKPGETSNVFQGPDGYYIIKLESTKGGKPIPFKKVKEDIIQAQTLQKQQDVILEHLEKIKEKVNVDVREDLLN